MPFMDGTGPLGNGPRGGRGRGTCAGTRSGSGQGMGLGRGAGRGKGLCQQRANAGAPDQKAVLEQEATLLERQQNRIRQKSSGLGIDHTSK